MIKNFTLNANTYIETFERVRTNANNLSKCKELHNKIKDLLEATPESEALHVLDELLNEYYEEILKLMYIEVVENIFKAFHSAV